MAQLKINVRRVPTEVMYLVVIDQMLKNYRDVILERANDNFDQVVYKLAAEYIADGAIPTENIRTAVMNVADDVMAGRDVTLRAGDYIALMQYAKDNRLL